MRYCFLVLVLLFFSCQFNSDGESFDDFLKNAKDQSEPINQQLIWAQQAYTIAVIQKSDSLQLKASMELLRIYLDKQDSLKLKKQLKTNLKLSLRLKDTFCIAKSHSYIGYDYLMKYKYDSAYYCYYQASKLFAKINDSLQCGKSYLSMSIIEKDTRDYISSLSSSIMAEKLIKPSNDYRLLASIYNNLGIVSNELSQYDQSLKYHKQALAYRKSIDNRALIIESINNIGIVYKNQQNYTKALSFFNKGLDMGSNLINPKLKAMLLDNLGHTYFLSGTTSKSLAYLNNAYNIRVSQNDMPGLVVSYLHLAQFYKVIAPLKSKEMLLNAIKISKQINDMRDVLEGYKILSTLSTDNPYIDKFINISDSIKSAEANNINKFARIRFDSDLLSKEKNDAIKEVHFTKQQITNRNYTITLLIIILVLVSVLIFTFFKAYNLQRKLYSDFNHRTRNNLMYIQRAIQRLKNIDPHQTNHIIAGVKELDSTTSSQLLVLSLLEKSNDPKKVSLKLYLEQLAPNIILGYNDYKVVISKNLFDIEMNPQIISIIGLITNEFITNAFKYGYSTSEINTFGMDSKIDKKAGLEINLHTSGKFWDPNKVNSGTGLLIIKSLAAEIDANIVIEYNHHTTLKLTLKNQSNKLKVWKK